MNIKNCIDKETPALVLSLSGKQVWNKICIDIREREQYTHVWLL
jgi:hypothetical protein